VSPLDRKVHVVTQGGKRFSGIRLNEDTYSLQLLDSNEKLIALPKKELKEYRLDYTICHPGGCNAEIDASPELMASLKSSGGFMVTVSYKESGVSRTCWPGWGYGDINHQHCGPPGLANKPPPPGQSSQATQGSSDEHGKSEEKGNPKR
jgi:hypothetical protein